MVSKSHLDRDALHKAGWNNCNAVVYGLNGALADSVYDSQLLADIMVWFAISLKADWTVACVHITCNLFCRFFRNIITMQAAVNGCTFWCDSRLDLQVPTLLVYQLDLVIFHVQAPARDPYTASVVSHILKDWGDAKVRLKKVSPEARLILSDAQHRSIGDSTDPQGMCTW